MLFCRLLTFFKINFFKNIFQEYYPSKHQTGWIWIRTDVLSVLIWIWFADDNFKSTCTSKKRVKEEIFLKKKNACLSGFLCARNGHTDLRTVASKMNSLTGGPIKHSGLVKVFDGRSMGNQGFNVSSCGKLTLMCRLI